MSKTDRVVALCAVAFFAALGSAALALQIKFAETLYIKRVIATLAGCW